MTSHDIARIIENFAPLQIQETWDNSGMQIDNNGTEISAALLCIDVTEEVIDEAIEKGCGMIISHHPLLFSGLKRINNENYISRCVSKAIKNDIAIYAAHTNMDKVAQGVSGAMCRKLGLTKCKILDESGNGTGLGMYGEFPAAIDEYEFLSLVKSIFKTNCIKHSALTGRKIRTVALCGGSGAELIDKAMEIKMDAYISADIKYHEFLKAENNILIADIGHYESEQYTKEIFFDLLSKNIDNFVVLISEKDCNPVFCF